MAEFKTPETRCLEGYRYNRQDVQTILDRSDERAGITGAPGHVHSKHGPSAEKKVKESANPFAILASLDTEAREYTIHKPDQLSKVIVEFLGSRLGHKLLEILCSRRADRCVVQLIRTAQQNKLETQIVSGGIPTGSWELAEGIVLVFDRLLNGDLHIHTGYGQQDLPINQAKFGRVLTGLRNHVELPIKDVDYLYQEGEVNEGFFYQTATKVEFIPLFVDPNTGTRGQFSQILKSKSER